MPEYYAVERTGSSLQHYGVKGMKWGVRKAIEKKNGVRLAKHYAKAVQKLNKLNQRADIDTQKTRVKDQLKKAKRSALVGAGAAAAGLGSEKITIPDGHMDVTNHYWTNVNGYGNVGSGTIHTQIQTHRDPYFHKAARLISGAATVGALTKAGVHTAKAIAAKRRTSLVGHAKAVAKRDAWKKSMQEAFRGTQYDASGSVRKNKKRRR